MIRRFILTLFLLFFFLPSLFADLDPAMLAGMKARSIGPAGMSGRVASIDVVRSNPDIMYVGAATGGLWKSVNGGISWNPIFDDQPVAAIGAVSIFQQNPDVVWVGTGEGNPRNSASVGNGVYKSLDGGRTWKHLGLDQSERIHRIVLHPTNVDIAYVAAMGREWGEGSERGIFKTEDGGKTWSKVLYVNDKTGAADLVMDPSNPNKLFAAMWQFRRWPWFFQSGGPGSGLYVTNDGGRNWRKLTEEDGLPKGNLGRIGVAIVRSNPETVYALVEAEKSALIRSDDGGKKWNKVNEQVDISDRPFYYGDIRVDPTIPTRVYKLESLIRVSNDGGKTFEVLVPFRDIHPDHHAMWINPDDPSHIVIGNDGGVAISSDRGSTWRFVSNLPFAQFYHVRVDMDTPYHVYGGLQDNGSWRGPSEVLENGGIRNQHWEEVGFGDGFDVVPDPKDSMMGYAMSQEGYLIRWNLHTGERKDIRPAHPEGVKLRYNWNAGIAIDPFDTNTIYFGSQFLHKSTDRGETWSIISPDLTTNNPEWQKQDQSGGLTPDVTAAENFTTIIAIAPSRLDRNVIWIGTDDGRLHVMRDGGKTWKSIEKNVPGVPANTWIPHIKPSHFDAATAFVVFDDHRRSNWTSYVYRTNDYGSTWKSLASKDLRGYALAIEQDPVKQDLLYLGTEFGLYVTLNGGQRWMKWTHGFPTVSAMDLVVHPRDHDLVIATHGRALYILDDVRPLRTLTESTMKEPLHVYEISDARQYMVKQTGGSRFPGNTEFRGENRPYGAIITYSLNVKGLPHPDEEKERDIKETERQTIEKEKKTTEVRFKEEDIPTVVEKEEEKGPQVDIKITDENGKIIRKFKSPARLGLNRAVWDLAMDPFKEPPREEPALFGDSGGPQVLPGNYTVTVKFKEHQATSKVRVVGDQRYKNNDAARKVNWQTIMRAGELQETATKAIEQIRNSRTDIDFVLKRIASLESASKKDDTEESPYKSLQESARGLMKDLDQMERKLWTPPKTKGIPPDKDVWSKIIYIQGSIGSSWDTPTPAQLTYLKQAEALLRQLLQESQRVFRDKVTPFRKQVEQAKIVLLPMAEDISVQKKSGMSVTPSVANQPKKDEAGDPHSFARPNEAVVKHLDLDIKADFTKKQISGKAGLRIENKGRVNKLYLDSRDLKIEKVTLGENQAPTKFQLGESVKDLGQPLVIDIEPDTALVNITYSTSPDAAALQWLDPSQTAAKKHPFLFTQSQTILARTWIPCQDSPGVRMTYRARVQTPPGLMAVMSAENPTKLSLKDVYEMDMTHPIPSYLMALAVGDIAFRSTGPRSGVYAEPSLVEKAAWEFGETEKMIAAAEKLYGPYRWGRYDIIVLPPSFPYGGMENPRLTFATPTVLAGDRSLVSLVAHELAHSWSGNLVTNATWNDFWLNEGFTTYFEHRIMEEVYGRDYDEMLALLSYQDLQHQISELGAQSPDTHLRLNLSGRDPDEGTTDIAYQKGYYFLRTIEENVGRARWDAFLRKYFDRFAFQSITTAQFLEYLHQELVGNDKGLEQKLQINAWVYGAGIPANVAVAHSDRFEKVEQQIQAWTQGTPVSKLETAKWTTHEWLHFLRKLPTPLTSKQMSELDQAFDFSKTGNSEVMNEWLLKVIVNRYEPAYLALERFVTGMGRRKFLRPLFMELAKTPEGLDLAKRIYAKARPTYHSVSRDAIDQILKWEG